LTKEEFEEILLINKTGGIPVLIVGGHSIGKSVREMINDFWSELAEKKGFNFDTIEPIDNTHFYAEPKVKTT
jgi:hypothetical protein